MRKCTTILFLCFLTNISFAQKSLNEKLRIEINKNVELLGLGYFIGFEGTDIETKTVEIGGKKIPKKEWHCYGFFVYERYKSFAASENLGKALP